MQEGKPSNTAFAVALGCVCILKSSKPPLWDHRIVGMLEGYLQLAPLPFRVFNSLFKFRFGCKIANGLMNVFIPGMFAHYVVRKMFIEEQVRKSLAAGITQIVSVGAGFDTLAIRLALDFPDVSILEVDHPSTQNTKMKSAQNAAQISVSIPENFKFTAADLTSEPLHDVLKRAGYNSVLPGIFIIEGVLMYLKESQVAQVFTAIHQSASQKSVCIFTFMEKDPQGRTGFGKSNLHAVNAWLKLKNEPFQWGIAPKHIAVFVEKKGWKISTLSTHENMVKYLQNSDVIDANPAIGEHVGVANWQ